MSKNSKSPPESDALVKKDSTDVVTPQLVELLEEQGVRVNVNAILVNLQQQSSPEEFIDRTRDVIALVRELEGTSVENFKAMAEAIIEVKQKDPDEQEKRRNNRARRGLKYVVGGSALAGVVGTAAASSLEGNLILISISLAYSIVALSIAGVLASGESVSSNDVVRIMHAMNPAKWIGSRRDDDDPAKTTNRKRRR